MIKFGTNATVVTTPTTNYASLITAIDGLTSNGGNTNFGSPLDAAINYFYSNDTQANGWEQYIVLLSDGEPTVGSGAMTPIQWAINRANDAKARDIGLYTIAMDLSDIGVEIMAHLSSSTYLNQAWNLSTATQETTFSSSYPATGAVDGSKAGNAYSSTANNTTTPRWQVNLGQSVRIDNIKVWNRVANNSDETSDARVWVST